MAEEGNWLKEHEKFIAFLALGIALLLIAVMVYLRPPSSSFRADGAGYAILNTIVGAFVLAFGGAANSLFKITASEKRDIADATASAITNGPPVPTEVTNTASQPVPTRPTAEGERLPPMFEEGK